MERLKQFRNLFLCNSIYESFKILHNFSKLFGFTSYKFDFNKKKGAYFDIFSTIQFSVIICIWLYIDYNAFKKFALSEYLVNSHDFVLIIFVAHAAINPSFYMLTIFYHNLKRKNVTSFLKTIYIFDENVKNLQWKFQFQNHNFSIIFVSIVTVMLIGLHLFYIWNYAFEFGSVSIEIFAIVLNPPIHVITMSNLLWSSIGVLERFKILNQNITWWHRELSVFRTLEREKLLLRNLTKLYGKLIE